MQRRGSANPTIISCLPEVKSCWLLAEEVAERKEVSCGAEEKWKLENVMTMGGIKGGHDTRKMKKDEQELSESSQIIVE